MAVSSEHAPDLGALLERVAEGDADAFASFYDATCARVFGLILRVLRDPGYSEETTQEVYAQVWRAAAGYDPAEGSAVAWVLTLAHRRARARGGQDLRSGRAGDEGAVDLAVLDRLAGRADARDRFIEVVQGVRRIAP